MNVFRAMRTHRSVEVESLAGHHRETVEGLREARRTVDHPTLWTSLHRVFPLAEAAFFAAVNLLAIADQSNEHAPAGDSIACSNKQLRLGRVDLLLDRHHL